MRESRVQKVSATPPVPIEQDSRQVESAGRRREPRQARVVLHLDTSFDDVQQDPGFQRRLLSEIATALRIPHQCIRVAAVEEQGAYAAVHLVLSDCDGGHKPAGGGLAQQSTSPRPNEGSGAKGSQMTLRLADELATDLWRQSQIADSQLKRGKCWGFARRSCLLLSSQCLRVSLAPCRT